MGGSARLTNCGRALSLEARQAQSRFASRSDQSPRSEPAMMRRVRKARRLSWLTPRYENLDTEWQQLDRFPCENPGTVWQQLDYQATGGGT